MPSFSERSLRRLETCDDRLQRIFSQVIEDWDCTIICGHRNESDQNKAFASGASKLRFPNSEHNVFPSRAVDVAPWPIPEEWGAKKRDEYEKFRYFAFFVLGVASGMGICLRWGGDWDRDKDVLDQDFNDLVHFELDE